MAKTALITVAVGGVYKRFAEVMMATAATHFAPTDELLFKTLPGVPGWPTATITRPKLLSEWLLTEEGAGCDFVFLVDADARFEAEVGPEILPPRGVGITATLHPGYVGKPPHELPFERDPVSSCHVAEPAGLTYFCGGFIGGDVENVYGFMCFVQELIDFDARSGRVPRWHDESAYNAALFEGPPQKVLTPAYCCPDDDSWYRSWWPESYERRIVMLDKTPAERGRR